MFTSYTLVMLIPHVEYKKYISTCLISILIPPLLYKNNTHLYIDIRNIPHTLRSSFNILINDHLYLIISQSYMFATYPSLLFMSQNTYNT